MRDAGGSVLRFTGRRAAIVGALVVVAVAVLVFTRFSLHNTLDRDESIYAYGGQRLADGVAPYASIFDPKGPLTTIIAGGAAAVGSLLGQSRLMLIRLVFFVLSVATALAVYGFGRRVWRSTVAGIVAGVVFSCFQAYASLALAGPEAKTPGALAFVLCMWLVVDKRFFWAGVAAALAICTWQPLFIFPIVVVVAGLVESVKRRSEPTPHRWRPLLSAVAGVLVPLVLLVAFFAGFGAVGKLYETAIEFPASIAHGRPSLGGQLSVIAQMLNHGYGFDGYYLSGIFVPIGAGVITIVAVSTLVRGHFLGQPGRFQPIVSVVFLTMLFNFGYALYDFQGPSDAIPFLPYGAIGTAGLAVFVLRWSAARRWRPVAVSAVIAAPLVLVGFSLVWFSNARFNDHGLPDQETSACAVRRLAGPGTGGVWSLGDPMPLVLTGKVNPDRFIYLGEGVDAWKIRHTPGGFNGWTREIEAYKPAVVILQSWRNATAVRMTAWLIHAGYSPRRAGRWRLYVPASTMQKAKRDGIRLSRRPTDAAQDLTGKPLPTAHCT